MLRRLRTLVIMLLATLLTGPLFAADFEEGTDYETLSTAQPTSTDNRIEVVELFWYGCPHCNQLEPLIEPWVKKLSGDVQFVRIPAILRPEWELLARAYYAAEVLGVVEKTHRALFSTIHDEKRFLSNETQVRDFFVKQGVSEQDFTRAFQSFAVNSKVKRARDLTKRYGSNGVPDLIINGKYRTNGSLARGNANMLKVADYLIEQERKARTK
ncbi:MAG: disulfide bond formation protein DsbA [Gammaproteobacteria bacterium RBG_16_57_12]|nr:MAG: disulfide bond formation protein DsbA [Gammaproteobacteria bacterium RBG_16_57_12]